MRQLQLAFALTFVALAGCDNDDIENQLNASQAALAQESDRRLAEKRRADEAEAWVAELKARGNPLTGFVIKIAIKARSLGETSPPPVRRLATFAQLEHHDGTVWKVIDSETETPQIQAGEDGAYTLEFTYRPQDPREVLGRDIADLANIRGLRLHYADILNNIGLDSQFEVTSVTVIANGLPVVQASQLGAPAPPDSSGFQTLDVASHFQKGPDNYATALKERARARQSQAEPDANSAVEL
jgi:hypothetical protein